MIRPWNMALTLHKASRVQDGIVRSRGNVVISTLHLAWLKFMLVNH